MADIVQIDAAQVHIEFVKHPVIANPQLEFGAALETLVREIFKSCAHLVHLLLNGVADVWWQRIKGLGECRRPNLEHCGHNLFWLPHRVLPGRNFAAGLVELGFDLIG